MTTFTHANVIPIISYLPEVAITKLNSVLQKHIESKGHEFIDDEAQEIIAYHSSYEYGSPEQIKQNEEILNLIEQLSGIDYHFRDAILTNIFKTLL